VDALSPVALENVPTGHGRGTLEPVGQYDPEGHNPLAGLATTDDPLQKKPARHDPVATDSPALAQYWPVGQASHSETLRRVVRFPIVPKGQPTGTAVPVGQ
jgi:hypothetical protein